MNLDFSILEGSSFKVVPYENSRKLMIFFSGADRNEGVFDFWNVGNSQKANVIFVNNGINAWYQYGVPGLGSSIEETTEAFKGFARLFGADHISTYGISMGGYGAVLFAARMNCRALAFGLDTRLRLTGSHSLQRMPGEIPCVVPDLRNEILSSEGNFTIVAGEADIMDAVGATHVFGLPRTEVMTLRGVGHGAAPFLDREHGLAEIIRRFSEKEKLPSSVAQGDLCTSPEAVQLLWESAEARRQKQFITAERLARAALAVVPDTEAAMYACGLALEDQKRFDEALLYFAAVCQLTPHYAGAQLKLATCLRRTGRLGAADHTYRVLLKLKPESAQAMYWISKYAVKKGNMRKAFEMAEKAAHLKPENQIFASHLNTFTEDDFDCNVKMN